MRKRILPFALALVMVFTLCACGSTTGNLNRSVREGQQKLASVENCHLVLRLTVNPRLEIYLDETGTVLKAEADNQDGEKLLAVVELSGLSYEDAVNALLSTAAEQNLLPENARVQIDVLASAGGPLSPEQTLQLEQAVTDYNEGLVSFADQRVVVAESCGANQVQVENMANGDVFYSYFSNRERVREICYGADGSYHEWVYEDGQNVSAITVNADGSRQEEHCSYENGQLVFHSVQNPDILEETTYYSDGNLKTSLNIWPDGTVQERHYYENGNTKYGRDTSPDGSVSEEYYDEAGNRIDDCESSTR